MLRSFVAERLSPLKKRLKLDTPVIEEVPVTARVMSSLAIEFPEALGAIPVIVRGKAYGDSAGRWYRVPFAKALSEPSIVAVAEGRIGTIPRVAAPKITIPPVGIAKTRVEVPAAIPVPAPTTAAIPVTLIPYVNESFPYLVSDVAWVRDQICKPVNSIVASLYRVQDRLNDAIGRINDGFSKTKKFIEDGYGASKKAVDDTNKSISDLRLKSEGAINTGLKDSGDNTQKALNGTVVNTEDSVNQGLASLIPSLYAAWGLPSSMIITPIHVRNVTSFGFEFQSYGETTCYYLAVGNRL